MTPINDNVPGTTTEVVNIWQPPEPIVSTFVWHGAYAESARPWNAAQLDAEDKREGAFLSMAAEQLASWEPERARRILAYLAARFA